MHRLADNADLSGRHDGIFSFPRYNQLKNGQINARVLRKRLINISTASRGLIEFVLGLLQSSTKGIAN